MSDSAEFLREDILDLIPLDALYVQVKTAKGHVKWRPVLPQEGIFDEVLESDEIVLNGGKPSTMTKKPGRPGRKPTPTFTPPVASNPVNAQAQAAKRAFLDNDPLLKQIEQGVESEDILLLVMRGFAQESASLEFERLTAESEGKETSQLSIRRINALKALGDAWIKRKEQLAGKTIDMGSPAFGRLFGFMTDTFREAMLDGGVPRDQVETIFARLHDRMSDETWEQEAQNKMKGD